MIDPDAETLARVIAVTLAQLVGVPLVKAEELLDPEQIGR